MRPSLLAAAKEAAPKPDESKAAAGKAGEGSPAKE